MDKKNKNSGKFSTNSNYTQKQESSVNRRLKRPDQQAFYSGGNTNVTTPTNNSFSESGPPSRETNPSFSASNRLPNNFNRDKKPPIAASNMQLPPNVPSNFESMPPRFRKKWLQENDLPDDYFEKLSASRNQYGQTANNSMPPFNRSQTLPKGNGNRTQNRGNFYTPGASNTSSGYNNQSGRSPMRSRSRSSDQRGSRHSSRNSSLERSNVQERLYQRNTDRRYGARSPDFFKRSDNKNYAQNKGWTKQGFYSKSEDTGRELPDLSIKGKDLTVLDWSLEVEQEDEKRKWNDNHYHGRRSNRSHSRSNAERSNNSQPHSQQSSDRPFNAAYDHFKVPYSRGSRSRKNSQSSTLSRENSTDRNYPNRFSSSRENSTERYQVQRDPTNWRAPARAQSEQQQQKSTNTAVIAEMTKQFVNAVDLNKPGVLVLPNSAQLVKEVEQKRLMNGDDSGAKRGNHEVTVQKMLFDPKNPEKPILVNKTGRLPAGPSDPLLDYKNFSDTKRKNRTSLCEAPATATHPLWYNSKTDQYKSAYKTHLIEDLKAIDIELQEIVDSRELFRKWAQYNEIRHSGQRILIEFLKSDLKFCETENVEQHCWKLLFYNLIELLRRPLSENIDDDSKKFYKTKALEVIEPGIKFWEEVLSVLEEKYKFKLEEFVGANASARIYNRAVDERKFLKLALVSLQKVLIYLGDLARYKELINETNNYGKAKQYYTKAQQVMPKNGRPYNQLALLSVYSKRKIDAVYFYMRSLMSSNPFHSAREALIALFDETRKKYENNQKRRDEKNRLKLKEKEHRFDGGHLRRENWIHPEESKRVYRRFAPLDPLIGHHTDSTDDDELNQLDALEVNKRFITSFLHILGKLITKIGMESFVQCAIQMLREFRALIQHSPIAITCQRLLQLIALNMFAIDCSQLKDPHIAGDAHSEVHESAIIIGLLMFSIILERFLCVLKEALNAQQSTLKSSQQQNNEANKQQESNSNTSDNKNTSDTDMKQNNNKKQKLILPEDAKVMLPAIKVWCDWMRQQQTIWNPTPSFSDYKITADPWNGLASLMTLLENTDIFSQNTCNEVKSDYELVKLQEDFLFAGFTPLLGNQYDPVYVSPEHDCDVVENEIRLRKILNFGNEILCSCTPPILEKQILSDGTTEYVSVVQYRTEDSSDSEILLECISDEEKDENSASDLLLPSTMLLKALTKNKSLDNSNSNNTIDSGSTKNDLDSDEKLSDINSANNNDNAAEIRRLQRRKDELLRKERMQEKYNQRLQEILSQSTVALTIEVRPRFLVPDTNCFVDYLDMLKAITNAYPLYQLMVPLVVINELEGLSKGIKPSQSANMPANTVTQIGKVPITASILNNTSYRRTDTEHALKVAEASTAALTFLKTKPAAVKLVTTKGHQIKTFIASEDDSTDQRSNDDKILVTALNLCKPQTEERTGDTRQIIRDVVLITKDRNLRVKALSNDLPVRELPDFIKWAGLSS